MHSSSLHIMQAQQGESLSWPQLNLNSHTTTTPAIYKSKRTAIRRAKLKRA